jgi:hypothetical protein
MKNGLHSASKVLLDASRRSTELSVPIPCGGILIPAQMCYVERRGRTYDLWDMAWVNELTKATQPDPDLRCVNSPRELNGSQPRRKKARRRDSGQVSSDNQPDAKRLALAA